MWIFSLGMAALAFVCFVGAASKGSVYSAGLCLLGCCLWLLCALSWYVAR